MEVWADSEQIEIPLESEQRNEERNNSRKACIFMNLSCLTAIFATIGSKIVIKQGVTVASVLVARNITVISLACFYLRG